MKELQVKIKRIDKSFPLPKYETDGAVAFDLYTRVEAVVRPFHKVDDYVLLPANIVVAIPDGFALIIAARSSTAH